MANIEASGAFNKRKDRPGCGRPTRWLTMARLPPRPLGPSGRWGRGGRSAGQGCRGCQGWRSGL